MNDFAADSVGFLADWSIRWSVLIFGLILIFAIRPPRAVATRLWLARLVLIGGLLLPLAPRWWTIPVPQPEMADPGPTDQALVTPPPDAVVAPPTTPSVRYAPPPGGWETQAVQPTVATPAFTLPETGPSVSEAPAIEPLSPIPVRVGWSLMIATVWFIGCVFCLGRLAVGQPTAGRLQPPHARRVADGSARTGARRQRPANASAHY